MPNLKSTMDTLNKTQNLSFDSNSMPVQTVVRQGKKVVPKNFDEFRFETVVVKNEKLRSQPPTSLEDDEDAKLAREYDFMSDADQEEEDDADNEYEWVDFDPVATEQAKKENDHLLRKAHSIEEIARIHAYAHGKSSWKDLETTTRVLDEDGVRRPYNVQRIHTAHPGIGAHILTPKDVKSDSDLPQTINIEFMGTDPSNKHSVLRDLEPGGAGAASFAQYKLLILKQINDAILNFKESHPNTPVKIHIRGHSLGGADTQNCVAAMMEGVTQNLIEAQISRQKLTAEQQTAAFNQLNRGRQFIPAECRSGFNHIDEIIASPVNAAGTRLSTHLGLKADLASLHAQREAGNTNLTVSANYCFTEGDLVQQTGEASAFTGVPNTHANVTLFNFHHRNGVNPISLPKAVGLTVAGGLTAGPVGVGVALTACAAGATAGAVNGASAHCRHNFNPEKNKGKVIPVEIFDNTTNAEKVDKQLGKKSASLGVVQKVANTIYKPRVQYVEGVTPSATAGNNTHSKQTNTAVSSQKAAQVTAQPRSITTQFDRMHKRPSCGVQVAPPAAAQKQVAAASLAQVVQEQPKRRWWFF